MAGWKRWTVALVALVAGAAVIVLALRSPDGLKSAASVGSLFAGLVPLVLALVLWARRPPSVALSTSTTEQVDAAQRELATQVLSQWREEINVRRLDDPGPLSVRWQSTGLAVTRDGPGSGFAGQSDCVGEVAAGFRELKRRRLVILGAPGTGKTTLALLLLRELLEHPEPDEPVPVLLSMSGWDPDAESLPEWLARRLAEDYPALRATVFGPDAARALVARRRILPVLDGLDELPEAVQPSVLARLNETAADPLVLTCRTSEYRSAVTGPGGDALTGGAVIEPAPLTPADATRYLVSCLPPGSSGAWRDVLASLSAESPLGSALSTPLALWLLRKVYVDTRADPAPLCRFPDADAVVDHLLDHLVEAVGPRHAWDPVTATRWLAFLAHHMSTIGTRDLAWWQLHRAAPRAVAVTAGLVAGFALALADIVLDGVRGQLTFALVLGPTIGLILGLVVGFARHLTVAHVIGLFFGFDMMANGIGGALAGQRVPALTFTITGAVSVLVVAVLAVRGTGPGTSGPAHADLRLHGRTRLLVRKLVGRNESGLALRLVPGFTAAFVLGGMFGLVFDTGVELGGRITTALASALVLGLVAGLASWLAVGLIAWAETPISDERAQSPAVAFRRDVLLVCLKSIAAGVALGVVFGVQGTFSDGPEMIGLLIGTLVTVATAFGVGLHQASGRYLVTVLVLGVRGRIPLRLLAFLDDAHRLGVLRRAGPVYQFRHAELQDRLAGRRR